MTGLINQFIMGLGKARKIKSILLIQIIVVLCLPIESIFESEFTFGGVPVQPPQIENVQTRFL